MRVAIIPARGGSTRLPGKNIKYFFGKPIIWYSICAARASGVFDAVYVTTDSPLVASITEQYGAMTIWRPEELARDEVGTQEVMRHAVQWVDGSPEFACCIYATAPMLRPMTLQLAAETLERSSLDYIVPVATWLRDPGQFYMGRTVAFREGRSLIGPRTGMMMIDPATECDINVEQDWKRAEEMYETTREAA